EINGTLYDGFLDAPTFSHDRGFYDEAFSLVLTPPAAGAAVYYTLDGSDPSPDNPTAVAYEQPIPIAGTTIVRAAGYQSNQLPSPHATYTYLFPEDIVR